MKQFPKVVQGLGGPIKVKLKAKLQAGVDGSESAGLWRAGKRTIEICTSQSVREQWRSFYHELVHAALDDSGLAHFFTPVTEEATADLIATMRITEEGL